jgi:RNA polymerase sigma-70 factor (ECF subfamily)
VAPRGARPAALPLAVDVSHLAVGIAVNRCREILRLTPNYEEELAEDLAITIGSPDERIDLERAIARLPLRYREVFVLHDIYEHAHGEIAAMLGIDAGTSKSNLSRARTLLRKSMGDRYVPA